MFRRVIQTLIISVLACVVTACSSDDVEPNRSASGDRPLILPVSSADRPKIIAFGDSLTAGFGLSEKESYPFLLQQKLNAEGFDFEVVNAGVSGDTSLGGLERADWVLGNENAKILILELGANDLLRGLSPNAMKENLSKIIKKAKEKNVRVLLCGMLAPPTVGSNYQRDFVSAFPELADEHNVEFLPFLLDGIAMKKDLNQADGIHPNAQGTILMMENIYKILRPMIAEEAKDQPSRNK